MENVPNKLTIFISYSWSNTDIADQIEKDLSQLQITLKRDVRDIAYKSDIRNFMAQIREADFAILLISREYLQSKNCMIEVLHILQERDFDKKILPIVIENTGIYTSEGRMEYTKYWGEEKSKLENIISEHKPELVINEISELKYINSVHAEINQFIAFLGNIKNITFDELRAEGYKSLLSKVGFEDVSHLMNLLIISFVRDLDKREILLDEWLEKYQPTTDAYSIRAGISKAQGKIERAEFNYQKSLQLSDTNYIAMNNYAFMLMDQNTEHDKARELFEKAIELSPNLTEARLNLGVLLSNHYNDNIGAAEQYEEVIAINPSDPRSYNNMTNILKEKYYNGEDLSVEICRNYIQAITLKPNYVEARLGYSNFLSEFIHDFKGAKNQLDEILKIDPNSASLVDTLNKRIEKLIDRKLSDAKPGRNDKCPCGSGLKFKKCHGK